MNWLGTILAALAGFLVGGIWYGPLFGKAWQRESGLTDEAIKGVSMTRIFALVALLNLVAAVVLSEVLSAMDMVTLATAAATGGIIGFGFVATALGVNYLFALKSLKLFLIDASYWILIYIVMGAILGYTA